MDFYVRERYIPSWRRPPTKIARALRVLSNVTRIVLAILCVACAVLVFWPPQTDYMEPISFQIARGNVLAWAIILTLIGLLGSSIPMLVMRKRLVSVCVCVAGIAGLLSIAASNPYSVYHLFTYIWTCLALIGWLVGLGIMEGDPIILAAAGGACFGLFICGPAMGVGERIIILSALVGIRGLFWGYVLEE